MSTAVKSKIKRKVDIAEKVITLNGKEELKKDCKLIDGNYYKIGNVKEKNSGDCYFISNGETGTYFKASNTNIVWNYSIEEYINITKYPVEILNGIVEVDISKTGVKIDKGYFNRKDAYDFVIYNSASYFYVFDRVVKKDPNIIDKITEWDPVRGAYYLLGTVDKNTVESVMQKGHPKIRYGSLPTDIYNFCDYPKAFIKEIEKISYPEHGLDKLLRNYTIGCEIETSAGSLPEKKILPLGLIPLKDGSIGGHEYVTRVMQGNGTIRNLIEIFNNCSEYTRVREDCSLHYHVGNIKVAQKNNSKFVVAFWKLWVRLQGEIEEMIPWYKRDLSYLMAKRGGAKDHCKPLPTLGVFNIKNEYDMITCYERILELLNEGNMPVERRPGLYAHRKEGVQKWEWQGRYYSVNLIPYLFSDKHTIEFRLHSGTVNKYKSINWLLICTAILNYAVDNMDKVIYGKDKISLVDVLEASYEGEMLNYLIQYCNSRARNNVNMLVHHDLYGREFQTDHTYKFLNGKFDPYI
jgi:hypothetical protein